jgi:hypothetical protein
MFTLVKKYLSAFALALLTLSLLSSSIPASAQVALPNVCPPGGCPIIGNRSFSNYTKEDVALLIIFVANILTYFVAALAVLFIVFGGILMIVGRGEAGWLMIKNAVIGLVVAVMAYTIVFLVSQVAQTNFFS